MGNYSRKEILQLVEEEDVEFIRLQFTDMFGVIKNIAVTSRELPRVLDNRCRVDWTLITGECMENEARILIRLQSFPGGLSRERWPDFCVTSTVQTVHRIRTVHDIS